MEKQKVTQTTARSDEIRYLPNADPSEDWELKLFLKDIADNLEETDYETIKLLVKGEFGSGERILEKCSGPLDYFLHLLKMRKINRFNLLYLQSLIWHTNRKDLMTKFAEFGQKNDKEPLHFFMPSEEPVNGYRHVDVHVGGSICNLTNEEKEKQRHQLSRLLRIPLQFVFLDGIQPSNSILLTFMVPEISIEIFKSLKPTIEGISMEFVEDVLTIREIPLENKEPKDEKTEWEKEVKHLMEKEQKMKQELDLTLTQLLETEEELHSLKKQISLQAEESVHKEIPLEKQEQRDEKTELGKHLQDLEIEEMERRQEESWRKKKLDMQKEMESRVQRCWRRITSNMKRDIFLEESRMRTRLEIEMEMERRQEESWRKKKLELEEEKIRLEKQEKKDEETWFGKSRLESDIFRVESRPKESWRSKKLEMQKGKIPLEKQEEKVKEILFRKSPLESRLLRLRSSPKESWRSKKLEMLKERDIFLEKFWMRTMLEIEMETQRYLEESRMRTMLEIGMEMERRQEKSWRKKKLELEEEMERRQEESWRKKKLELEEEMERIWTVFG